MGTVSVRIDEELVLQAKRESKIQNRSKAKQLEYWAKIGKALSPKVSMEDVVAVSQGIKTIKVEPSPSAQSISVGSDDVFEALQSDRAKGQLAEQVTSARIYYEISIDHPGYLEQVDSVTKLRRVGSFKNGEFQAL